MTSMKNWPKWATASCLTSSTTKDHAQPSQRRGLQSQGNANGWRMGIVSFSIIAIRPDCWNIALHDWQTLNPPRLISCKDPLEEEGFRSGIFHPDKTSVVFAASDALSHYVLMMYELSKRSEFERELMELRTKPTSNSQLLQMAEKEEFNFYDDVLIPLIRSAESESAFKELMETLYAKRLIDIDDYTLAIL